MINSKVSGYKKTLHALRGDYQRAVEKQEREGLMGGAESVRADEANHVGVGLRRERATRPCS